MKSLRVSFFLSALVVMSSSVMAQAWSWGQTQQQPSVFGANQVPTSQARAPLTVQVGRVLDIQATEIEVQSTAKAETIGGVLGAALGAFASRNNSGQGQVLAGTVGALLGSQLGARASKEMRPAVQVIVKLDSGAVLAIVQENTDASLEVGELVYLVGQSPAVRVMKAKQLASLP